MQVAGPFSGHLTLCTAGTQGLIFQPSVETVHCLPQQFNVAPGTLHALC